MTTFLPFIAENHYGAFRCLIRELPDTYLKWHERHERAKLEREMNLQVVREFPINPEEFSEYCRREGRQGTEHLLWLLARHKAGMCSRVVSDDEES
jgi:hypothetical protein